MFWLFSYKKNISIDIFLRALGNNPLHCDCNLQWLPTAFKVFATLVSAQNFAILGVFSRIFEIAIFGHKFWINLTIIWINLLEDIPNSMKFLQFLTNISPPSPDGEWAFAQRDLYHLPEGIVSIGRKDCLSCPKRTVSFARRNEMNEKLYFGI